MKLEPLHQKTLTTMTEAYLVTDNVHIQYVYVYKYI